MGLDDRRGTAPSKVRYESRTQDGEDFRHHPTTDLGQYPYTKRDPTGSENRRTCPGKTLYYQGEERTHSQPGFRGIGIRYISHGAGFPSGSKDQHHYTLYRLGKRDPYLVPGDYTVVFVWEEPGYEPIRSDAVNIRVMDPKGREGHALRLLNEGDTHYRLGRIRKSDANYERLVQRYPESVYAAPALEVIFRNHQDGMDRVHQSRRLDSAIKLINDYADCDFNMVRMCFEIEDAVERGIVPDTFEDVLIRWTRHSNERVRRFANRVLKKWENRIE